MKLLFDENLSFKLCERIGDLFPGSSQVRLAGLSKADDRTVWSYAGGNGFVLVTLDADFAERAALLGGPPKVLWLDAVISLPLRSKSCCGVMRKPSPPSRIMRRHALKFMNKPLENSDCHGEPVVLMG